MESFPVNYKDPVIVIEHKIPKKPTVLICLENKLVNEPQHHLSDLCFTFQLQPGLTTRCRPCIIVLLYSIRSGE